MQEEKVSSSAHFITLTYDTRYVPIDPVSGLLSLRNTDLTLHFKRLRKLQSGNGVSNIKYYAVGEYGGVTARPHYHVLLFNSQPELVDRAWQLGDIHNGPTGVTGASVAYCLKYMMKNKRQLKSWLRGRPKEFAVMSKGLGISYLNETMVNWHIKDMVNRMYCNLKDGKKISMPRYYKDKIYYENERSAIRDAFEITTQQNHDRKFAKQSLEDILNEQKAIDAAFDRMYLSALKTSI